MENENLILKKRLCEMMKIFHDFCVENELCYYIAGGTLLGAVRHKGFIPWDDDIDIHMPRKDYDKLLSLRDKMQNGFKLRSYTYENKFSYGFCKLYDETTTYIEQQYDTKIVGGVYIDIFPLDDIGDNYKKAVKLLKNIKTRRRIVGMVYYDGKRQSFLKSLATRFFSLLPKSGKWYDWVYAPLKKYKGTESRLVANVFGMAFERDLFPRSDFGIPKLYDFEGYKFFGPQNADAILKQLYGDYMKLPPIEQRKGHTIIYIDLNMPYEEYQKINGIDE